MRRASLLTKLLIGLSSTLALAYPPVYVPSSQSLFIKLDEFRRTGYITGEEHKFYAETIKNLCEVKGTAPSQRELNIADRRINSLRDADELERECSGMSRAEWNAYKDANPKIFNEYIEVKRNIAKR